MKILVFSDSHGRLLGMYDAIERESPDAVIHLGDCYEDACDLRRSYPSLPVYAVRGNNDFEPDAPPYMVIAPENFLIYITHGHRERVTWSSVGNLPVRAAQEGCALALYGHTHRVFDQTICGVRVVNPGSISLPRGGPAGYVRMTVEGGQLLTLEQLDGEGAPYQERRENKGFRWF